MNFKPMQELMDRLTSWRIPGNSISVWIENKEVFNYSSGYADIENKIPMTPDKMINIYSSSKNATVVGALQLFEKGLFLLDDPVYDFIPEFRELYVQTENGEPVRAKNTMTMRHLFTMTSGLTYNRDTDGVRKAKELTDGKMNTLTFAKCLAEDPLAFEPGTQWKYSLSHDVLGAVVEVISGMKFRDYMKKNVFDPLGIENTYYHNDEFHDKMAEQYRFEKEAPEGAKVINCDGGVLINVGKNRKNQAPELDSGGGGIVSTVNEYAKFASALANGGVGATGERIISEATIRLMRENQLTQSQLETFARWHHKGYGYGLGVRTLMDKAVGGTTSPLKHFGWDGAAGANLHADLDNKISFFYAHHMLNPQEKYYLPRLINVLYTCITG